MDERRAEEPENDIIALLKEKGVKFATNEEEEYTKIPLCQGQ